MAWLFKIWEQNEKSVGIFKPKLKKKAIHWQIARAKDFWQTSAITWIRSKWWSFLHTRHLQNDIRSIFTRCRYQTYYSHSFRRLLKFIYCYYVLVHNCAWCQSLFEFVSIKDVNINNRTVVERNCLFFLSLSAAPILLRTKCSESIEWCEPRELGCLGTSFLKLSQFYLVSSFFVNFSL